MLLLGSCGPAWHLQKAEKHLLKAKEKGAKIESDTTFKTVKFNVVGPKATFDLGPILIHRKDGVVYVPILKDTVIYKDRIKLQIQRDSIEVDCPDEIKEVEVPVKVETKIQSGYTKWQYGSAIVGGVLFGVIVGFLLGKIIKVGI